MSKTEESKLNWWTPNLNTDETFRAVINASTNSGKSYLIESLLEQYVNEFQLVLVICPSRDQVRRYFNIIPGRVIFKSASSVKEAEEIINHLFDVQDEREDDGLKLFKMLFIFDDVAFDSKTKHSNVLGKVWANGRHSKISAIFVSQYHSMVSTQMKNNTQYFFILRLGSRQQLEYITKNYLLGTLNIGMDQELSEVKYLISVYNSHIKEKGDALVIDNSVYGENLFYYRAK